MLLSANHVLQRCFLEFLHLQESMQLSVRRLRQLVSICLSGWLDGGNPAYWMETLRLSLVSLHFSFLFLGQIWTRKLVLLHEHTGSGEELRGWEKEHISVVGLGGGEHTQNTLSIIPANMMRPASIWWQVWGQLQAQGLCCSVAFKWCGPSSWVASA